MGLPSNSAADGWKLAVGNGLSGGGVNVGFETHALSIEQSRTAISPFIVVIVDVIGAFLWQK
jgi:hypothetical protein